MYLLCDFGWFDFVSYWLTCLFYVVLFGCLFGDLRFIRMGFVVFLVWRMCGVGLFVVVCLGVDAAVYGFSD